MPHLKKKIKGMKMTVGNRSKYVDCSKNQVKAKVNQQEIRLANSAAVKITLRHIPCLLHK